MKQCLLLSRRPRRIFCTLCARIVDSRNSPQASAGKVIELKVAIID